MTKKYEYKTKVYYEDTDVGGIVYYANYLKFIERARTEMIYQQFKLSHQKLKSIHDAIFVVRSCNTKYLKSANFEDELVVLTSILKKTPVRLNLLQEVNRNNELLVSAEVELAIVDSKGKVKKIPRELIDTL
jgi:acyl-CoA thioester hydrolase|tara:strand:+ start:260 stop:655 length:396 start_codon:yes stop_codon:yes gene_type:complete